MLANPPAVTAAGHRAESSRYLRAQATAERKRCQPDAQVRWSQQLLSASALTAHRVQYPLELRTV